MKKDFEKMTNNELATKIKLLEIEYVSKKQKILKSLIDLDIIEDEFNKMQKILKNRINP